MTGKERAELRSAVNKLSPVLFIGKDGISESTLKEADDALKARELIKVSIQRNCEISAKEASQTLCDELGAEGVQIIGRKFSIYRKKPEEEI